jgi:hypothetical protein
VTTAIVVNNVPPTVGPIGGSAAPLPVNNVGAATSAFMDPGMLGTHTSATVCNPADGFMSGSGWMNSTAGACMAVPALTGKATTDPW